MLRCSQPKRIFAVGAAYDLSELSIAGKSSFRFKCANLRVSDLPNIVAFAVMVPPSFIAKAAEPLICF